MPLRHVELGHRWGGHPLYDLDAGTDVDPATLPLPGSVVDRLGAWAARWDTTFDVAHPDRPRVEQFVIDELGRDGARLWRALLGLLAPQEWVVTYTHAEVVYREVADLPLEWRIG